MTHLIIVSSSSIFRGCISELGLQAGNTPLHHAASGSSDQGIMALRNVTMEHLISAAAHLETPNKQGRSPLHMAAASNNLRALRQLLNAGAHRAPIDAVSLSVLDLHSDKPRFFGEA